MLLRKEAIKSCFTFLSYLVNASIIKIGSYMSKAIATKGVTCRFLESLKLLINCKTFAYCYYSKFSTGQKIG